MTQLVHVAQFKCNLTAKANLIGWNFNFIILQGSDFNLHSKPYFNIYITWCISYMQISLHIFKVSYMTTISLSH